SFSARYRCVATFGFFTGRGRRVARGGVKASRSSLLLNNDMHGVLNGGALCHLETKRRQIDAGDSGHATSFLQYSKTIDDD
ncbi:MAG: hypothetical protein WAL59_21970, partial [Roseiarcus sp.]